MGASEPVADAGCLVVACSAVVMSASAVVSASGDLVVATTFVIMVGDDGAEEGSEPLADVC